MFFLSHTEPDIAQQRGLSRCRSVTCNGRLRQSSPSTFVSGESATNDNNIVFGCFTVISVRQSRCSG